MLPGVKRFLRYEYLLFKRLKGNRRQIAKGFAVGLAMNFIPTMGIGVPLTYFVAGVFRANRIATILSNLGTKAGFPLYYAANYIVGELLVRGNLREIQHLVATTRTGFNWHQAARISYSFLAGSVVNAVVMGIATYCCMNCLLAIYHTSRQDGMQSKR